jgi:hypothetical protein
MKLVSLSSFPAFSCTYRAEIEVREASSNSLFQFVTFKSRL